MRILLTGGRRAETLHLSRLFHRLGITVVVADSIPYNITALSCAVRKSYFIPPAKQEPMRFAYSLLDIIRKEAISVLIPTCAELYTVLKYESVLRPHADIFAPTYKNALAVLSPFRFYEWMTSKGLPSMPVVRFTSIPSILSDIQKNGDTRTYAPEWRRHRTIHQKKSPSNIICTPKNPWVGWDSTHTKQWKSYSWIDQGKVLFHILYARPEIEDPSAEQKIKDWTESFAQKSSYTGQLSTIFVEHRNQIVAHSCTPELTCGIYSLTCCETEKQSANSISDISMNLTKGTVSSSFSLVDPIPTVGSFLQHSVIAYRSLRRGISIRQGKRFDIEWGAE